MVKPSSCKSSDPHGLPPYQKLQRILCCLLLLTLIFSRRGIWFSFSVSPFTEQGLSPSDLIFPSHWMLVRLSSNTELIVLPLPAGTTSSAYSQVTLFPKRKAYFQKRYLCLKIGPRWYCNANVFCGRNSTLNLPHF